MKLQNTWQNAMHSIGRIAPLSGIVLLLFCGTTLEAGLITVDWVNENVVDGIATGALGSFGVTLTSTDGSLNGGRTFGSGGWAALDGTDGVSGIGDAGVVNEAAAFDWNAGQQGFVNFALDGATVTNPTLLFNYADNHVETFDFDDSLSLSIIDQGGGGTVTIAAGNVVTTDGNFGNVPNDSFAIQLTGTFSSINFLTNVNLEGFESLGVTLAADESNLALAAVPEPSSISFLAFGLGGVLLRRRRRRQKENGTIPS